MIQIWRNKWKEKNSTTNDITVLLNGLRTANYWSEFANGVAGLRPIVILLSALEETVGATVEIK